MQINLKFVILSLSGSTRNAEFDYENVIWNTSRFLNNSSIIPSYLTFKMWVNHTGIIQGFRDGRKKLKESAFVFHTTAWQRLTVVSVDKARVAENWTKVTLAKLLLLFSNLQICYCGLRVARAREMKCEMCQNVKTHVHCCLLFSFSIFYTKNHREKTYLLETIKKAKQFRPYSE